MDRRRHHHHHLERLTLTITRELTLDDTSGRRFLEIYEEAFWGPTVTRRPRLLASIAAGERSCFIARRDGELVGFAVVFELAPLAFGFLESLAVAVAERNAGIGGRLLDHVGEQLRADGARGVLLEVDRPADAAGDERALRERRIGFYERHRAALVDCAPRYRAPDLNDERLTVPYSLMWLPLASGAPARLRGPELSRAIEAILVQSYGLEPDDPRVAEVVGELAC
jgi:ribosomal protein S18 acetylase RimI-like enzyme